MGIDVFDLYAKISLDTKEYDRNLGSAKKSFSDFASGLKSAAGAIAGVLADVAKGATIAVSAASAAVTGLVKQSLSAYANYEQLVGGVDKIFGESSKKVQQYADEAYKTAGISSNQYMEQVTSFSASLLQGLKGDTEQAADIANMAIKDMADNANTYGTDISQIQSNYQALAKQNYTLLDNLKLGYGGTKAEMARLLNDANKIDSTILGKGVTVDDKFENVTFDQMIRAIHTIQQELKITGTTADEAGRTISGSVGSMKAAWQNFLTGTGTPEQFVEVLETSLDNITAQLDKIVPKLMTGLSKLMTLIAPKIPGLLNKFLPTVISGASTLLTNVAQNLPGLITTVLPALVDGATQVMTALVTELPGILKSLADAIPLVLATISENSGTLLEAAKTIIGHLVDFLSDAATWLGANAGRIINEFATFLTDTNAIAKIVKVAGDIINNLVSGLVSEESLTNIVQSVPKLLEALGKGVKEAADAIGTACQNIISGIVDYLFGDNAEDHWADLITAAGAIIDFLWDGMKAILSIPGRAFVGIAKSIADALGVGEYWQYGYDMIKDMASGMWSALTDWMPDFSRIGEGIYDALHPGASRQKVAADNTVYEAEKIFGNKYTDEDWENNQDAVNLWNYLYEKNEGKNVNPEDFGVSDDDIKIMKMYDATSNFKSTGGQVSNADQIASWAKWHHIQGVPVFGNGGIVTKPTLAMIGEDGAEAVVPLEKDSEVGRRFGGGNMTIEKIEVNVNAHGIDDINEVGNIIVQQIDSALRRYQVQQTRGIGGTAW